jgi:hypothetical protein
LTAGGKYLKYLRRVGRLPNYMAVKAYSEIVNY